LPTKGLGHQVELLKVYSTDTQLEARLEKSGSEQLKSIDCGMDASRRGKGAMLCNITEKESTFEETTDTEQTQTRARRIFFMLGWWPCGLPTHTLLNSVSMV
jgi:hypothetical protein